MSRWKRSSLRCDDGSPIVNNTYDLPVAHERRHVMTCCHHLEVFIHIKGESHFCTVLVFHRVLSHTDDSPRIWQVNIGVFASGGKTLTSLYSPCHTGSDSTHFFSHFGSNSPLTARKKIVILARLARIVPHVSAHKMYIQTVSPGDHARYRFCLYYPCLFSCVGSFVVIL
jgi:hypothetical protein